MPTLWTKDGKLVVLSDGSLAAGTRVPCRQWRTHWLYDCITRQWDVDAEWVEETCEFPWVDALVITGACSVTAYGPIHDCTDTPATNDAPVPTRDPTGCCIDPSISTSVSPSLSPSVSVSVLPSPSWSIEVSPSASPCEFAPDLAWCSDRIACRGDTHCLGGPCWPEADSDTLAEVQDWLDANFGGSGDEAAAWWCWDHNSRAEACPPGTGDYDIVYDPCLSKWRLYCCCGCN